jgi:hypothetical protein
MPLLYVCSLYLSKTKNILLFLLGCLPNPEKNESVLKAFAIYAIKNHKQSLADSTESSILTVFKQAISDGIKSKECYALAVCSNDELILEIFVLTFVLEWYWSNVIRRSG